MVFRKQQILTHRPEMLCRICMVQIQPPQRKKNVLPVVCTCGLPTWLSPGNMSQTVDGRSYRQIIHRSGIQICPVSERSRSCNVSGRLLQGYSFHLHSDFFFSVARPSGSKVIPGSFFYRVYDHYFSCPSDNVSYIEHDLVRYNSSITQYLCILFPITLGRHVSLVFMIVVIQCQAHFFNEMSCQSWAAVYTYVQPSRRARCLSRHGRG